MRRVEDYRKNAKDCRDLAAKMPAEARSQLLEFARHWDDLAEERERYLANRGLTDEPDPTLGPS
jgi:hypothetical protein